MLQQILDQMFVDPELLDELSKEQKEILFHKIREEQVRRWRTRYDEMRRSLKPLGPPKIKWDDTARMLPEDGDIDPEAARKRAEQLEAARVKKAQEEDERQARILAEIQVKEQVERTRLQSVAKKADLDRREQEDRVRLEKEKEERRKKEEHDLYMSQKEAKEALKKEKELEAQIKKEAAARKKEYERLEKEAAKAEAQASKQVAKAQAEIYMTMQEVRAAQLKKQKEEEKKMESFYAEAKKKADRHTGEKQAAVKAARERANSEGSLRESKTVEQLEQKRKSMMELSSVDSGNPAARPSRPPDENAVITWWKAEEGPRNVGRSPTGDLEKWFHGPISRQASEALLEGQGNGAFLIRLSTRIWGYTLSFNDTDKAKHFLVDAADGQYSVFGAQTRSHTSLATMVQFHASIPVSKNGTKLTKPIGKNGGNTDSLAPLL